MAIDLATERWESLKAGMGGAFWFTVARALATIFNETILADLLQTQGFLPLGGGLWLDLGAAVGCGFLFGITYRYARGTDPNPFLQQGVVLAFGLTRAAGAIAPTARWLSWGIFAAEGLIGYGVAAVGLDWALRQGWVRPLAETRDEGE